METVVNQHGLDIESMKPPCNPVNSGPQIRDSVSTHSAGTTITYKLIVHIALARSV